MPCKYTCSAHWTSNESFELNYFSFFAKSPLLVLIKLIFFVHEGLWILLQKYREHLWYINVGEGSLGTEFYSRDEI